MISDRMRDRAKFNTAVDPYRLLVEGAHTIDALSIALSALVKHAEELEARSDDYHALGEDGPVCSMPLANAIFALTLTT